MVERKTWIERVKTASMPRRRAAPGNSPARRELAKSGTLARFTYGSYRMELMSLGPNAGRGLEERAASATADEGSVQRLQALVANSPLAVIEWDFQHRVVQWTGNAENIFGWNASEVVGKRADEWHFVYEDDWEQVHAAMDAMEHGRNFISQHRNYRKDGSLILGEWCTSVLVDRTGSHCGALSLALDTTDHQRTEEALRLFEKKYREIVEMAPVGIFVSTVDGQLLTLNSRLAVMLGYDSPEEIMTATHNIGEQFSIGTAGSSPILQRAISSDGFVASEIEYRRRDGSVWDVCVEGFAEHITQRKGAEDALRGKEQQLASIYNTDAIKSGIDMARREAPDLILLDIQIPEMDGYEVAAVLKSDPVLARIPIIGVSSFAMPGDRDRATRAGFAGYIEKPVDPERFVESVMAFLERTGGAA